MSYESPITVIHDIANQMNADIENRIYQAVIKIGIDVNKEELVKALQYDRNQYEKGYADGRNDAITHARILITDDGFIRCSACGKDMRYPLVSFSDIEYCPRCGAKIDEDK